MNQDILECHSRGDKRFSALYARLASGQTIEQLYQGAKRDEVGRPYSHPKGQRPAKLHISSSNYEADDWLRHGYYHMLWAIYLLENPELLAIASQYQQFRDQFSWGGRIITRGESLEDPTVGCNQAYAIMQVVNSYDYDAVLDWQPNGPTFIGILAVAFRNYWHHYHPEAQKQKDGWLTNASERRVNQ